MQLGIPNRAPSSNSELCIPNRALFHPTPPPWQALFGDGDVTDSQAQQKDEGRRRSVPLHEAISRAKDGRGTAHSGVLARATVQQVNDTAHWLAERFFTDGWAVLSKEARTAAGDAVRDAGQPPPDAMSHYASQRSRRPPRRMHAHHGHTPDVPMLGRSCALLWPIPRHVGLKSFNSESPDQHCADACLYVLCVATGGQHHGDGGTPAHHLGLPQLPPPQSFRPRRRRAPRERARRTGIHI